MGREAVRVLDFRGEDCPDPLVKAVKAVSEAGECEVIKVLTDSETCARLIKESVELFKLGSVRTERVGDCFELVIRASREVKVGKSQE